MPALESSGSGGGGDGNVVIKVDELFENWLAPRLKEFGAEIVPNVKNVYQWNITKDGKVVSVWTIDMKNGEGAVHKGQPKTGSANCTLTIDDDLAIQIFEGKLDAMRAFMTGKLKIGGNVLAAQKLQQLWEMKDERDPPPTLKSKL